MQLSEQILTLEATLSQFTAEFQQLAEQVQKLEEENERLRQQLSPEELSTAKGLGGGQEALGKLYDEGYHICPANYGREHQGGCIFCQEVLSRVTK